MYCTHYLLNFLFLGFAPVSQSKDIIVKYTPYQNVLHYFQWNKKWNKNNSKDMVNVIYKAYILDYMLLCSIWEEIRPLAQCHCRHNTMVKFSSWKFLSIRVSYALYNYDHILYHKTTSETRLVRNHWNVQPVFAVMKQTQMCAMDLRMSFAFWVEPQKKQCIRGAYRLFYNVDAKS